MPAAVPVHRRTIDIEVRQADDLLVAQARLRDTRPWHPDPARVLLHDLELALHVRTADLTIVAVESRMNAFPHTECPLIRPNFDRLVGLSVRRGFTRALRDTVSGVHGCSHLHELPRAAGPTIIQATLSAADARRRGPHRNLPHLGARRHRHAETRRRLAPGTRPRSPRTSRPDRPPTGGYIGRPNRNVGTFSTLGAATR